jgi:integrase
VDAVTPHQDTDELRGGMFAMMLLTGLRIGEAQGLRWSDIAPDYRSFRVNQQLLEGDGKPYSFGEPKSQGGRRDVPLSPDAIRVLRDQRQRVVARRLLAGSRWQDMDSGLPRRDRWTAAWTAHTPSLPPARPGG